jgi:hypothetical protein
MQRFERSISVEQPFPRWDGKEPLEDYQWRNRLRPMSDDGFHLSERQLKRLWIRGLINLRDSLISCAKVMYPKQRDYKSFVVRLGKEVKFIEISDSVLDSAGEFTPSIAKYTKIAAEYEKEFAVYGGRTGALSLKKTFALRRESEQLFAFACRCFLDAKDRSVVEFSRGHKVGRPKGLWPLTYLSLAEYWLGAAYMQLTIHRKFARIGGKAKDRKTTASERESTIAILRTLIASYPNASANTIEYDTLRRWASQIKKGQEPTTKR